MTPEEYLKDRVEDQIEWYDRKSASNKKWFMIFQIATLAASASVPVFAIFESGLWSRLTVAVLGAAAAVTTGIVSLYKFREHWVDYRTTAESLKHEKYKYLTGADPYVGDGAFSILVERIESMVSKENTAWQERLTAREEKKGTGSTGPKKE